MKAVVLAVALLTGSALAQTPPQQPARVDPVRGETPVDALNMERPIDMHDTVWIGELTTLEVRDLIKAGNHGTDSWRGMEENGPYLTLDKHNNVARAMGEAIARRLGNALCAPILTMEPGNPEKPSTPAAWCSPRKPIGSSDGHGDEPALHGFQEHYLSWRSWRRSEADVGRCGRPKRKMERQRSNELLLEEIRKFGCGFRMLWLWSFGKI